MTRVALPTPCRIRCLLQAIGLAVFWLALSAPAFSQTQPPPDSLNPFADSVRSLAEVRVVGYATNRTLAQTGASVGLLGPRELQQRTAGTPTLVPAMNTLPGVRMDERSPGSYRLSIRGSLIRSPFGVRNVKVYWQDLPLTDAGGSSPINALDVRSIGHVEVIRGPGGSLYGAGTGGTVLFSGPTLPIGQTRIEASVLAGGYGLMANGLTVETAQKQSSIRLAYNHLQSTGYRDHSALVRDNLQLNATVQPDQHQTLSVLGLYSDLAYQTPGGLTDTQFRADPSASRPATKTLPSSADQQAGIYQRYAYLGLAHEIQTNDNRIRHRTAIYTSNTDFRNPFITNYERRTDQGIGGRMTTQLQLNSGPLPGVITVGGEFQQTFTVDRNYGNRRGQLDTLQTDDELRAQIGTLFVQIEQRLPLGLLATVGLSRNSVNYGFTRFSGRGPLVGQEQSRPFTPVWLPRVSVLKRVGLSTTQPDESMTVFLSVSSGYSAPTSAEVLSATGQYNPTLEPERGQSTEIGLRGLVFGGKFRFELDYYLFVLQNTIVSRTANNGAMYFVNAGQTAQPGVELQLQYQPFLSKIATEKQLPIQFFQLWHSLSLTNYHFRDYVQTTTDLSGNRVTGVPPVTASFGVDAEGRVGWYAHTVFSFLNPFPLNDANTAIADPTRILTATIGYRRKLTRHVSFDLFLTGDNLLDQSYSLGYDLNAAAGRYYNAAPRRAFSVGIRVKG